MDVFPFYFEVLLKDNSVVRELATSDEQLATLVETIFDKYGDFHSPRCIGFPSVVGTLSTGKIS